MPQILIALKESIEQEEESITDWGAINVIQGYSCAPHTLDMSLLVTLKERFYGMI